MTTYIFLLSDNRILVIKANDIRSAMDKVEKEWYPAAFAYSFQVLIATGTSL